MSKRFKRTGGMGEMAISEKGPSPVRAFGKAAADLDIEFATDNRPGLVTALLSACCFDHTTPLPAREAAAWELTVGERIRRLLKMAELTLGAEKISVHARCPAATCGEEFEIVLPFRDFAPRDGRREVIVPLASQRVVRMRLPTGRDQANWKKELLAEPAEAIAGMMASLVCDLAAFLPASEEEMATVDALMEEADPLVSFTVDTACPHCGRDASIPVDLEAAALECLGRCRARLLRQIHQFAKSYGWTETQVLALPASRRAEYMRLMETEDSWRL